MKIIKIASVAWIILIFAGAILDCIMVIDAMPKDITDFATWGALLIVLPDMYVVIYLAFNLIRGDIFKKPPVKNTDCTQNLQKNHK